MRFITKKNEISVSPYSLSFKRNVNVRNKSFKNPRQTLAICIYLMDILAAATCHSYLPLRSLIIINFFFFWLLLLSYSVYAAHPNSEYHRVNRFMANDLVKNRREKKRIKRRIECMYRQVVIYDQIRYRFE